MQAHGNTADEAILRARSVARQRVYRSARGHSARVRFAKWALPVIGVLAIVVMMAYAWLVRVAPDVQIDIAGSAIRDGKLVMANPKVDGVTKASRPYSVRAARAVQDLKGSGLIDLERMTAVVPMSATVNATFETPFATLDSEKNILDVKDKLSIVTSDGMSADFTSAVIDLAGGGLTTSDPVRIVTPGAVLTADSMRAEDSGKRLLFERRVKLVIQPGMFERNAQTRDPAAGTDG